MIADIRERIRGRPKRRSVMDVTRTYGVVQMVTLMEVNAEGRKKWKRIIFCSDT